MFLLPARLYRSLRQGQRLWVRSSGWRTGRICKSSPCQSVDVVKAFVERLCIKLILAEIDTTLYKAPEDLKDNHLILMAGSLILHGGSTNTDSPANHPDILPTGFSVVQKAWDLLSEKERKIGGLSALVIGCGPVGLCASYKVPFDIF
jgi:hypothetical protein